MFFYKGEQRIGMVLNPSLEGKMHVIKLDEIPYDLFEKIFRPEIKSILGITDNNVAAKKLYEVLKPQLPRYDCYRTYFVKEIRAITVLDLVQGNLPDEDYVAEEVVEEQSVDLTKEQQ